MDAKCVFHPQVRAVELCAKCNKPICQSDVRVLAVSKPGFCSRIPLCPKCYSQTPH